MTGEQLRFDCVDKQRQAGAAVVLVERRVPAGVEAAELRLKAMGR